MEKNFRSEAIREAKLRAGKHVLLTTALGVVTAISAALFFRRQSPSVSGPLAILAGLATAFEAKKTAKACDVIDVVEEAVEELPLQSKRPPKQTSNWSQSVTKGQQSGMRSR